jgi:hypothetical protein
MHAERRFPHFVCREGKPEFLPLETSLRKSSSNPSLLTHSCPVSLLFHLWYIMEAPSAMLRSAPEA